MRAFRFLNGNKRKIERRLFTIKNVINQAKVIFFLQKTLQT